MKINHIMPEFQASILQRGRENHISPITFQTDGQTDVLNYGVALLLKKYVVSMPTELYILFVRV